MKIEDKIKNWDYLIPSKFTKNLIVYLDVSTFSELLYFYIFFQEFYNKVFSTSRLQTHSGIDMSNCSTENVLNLFLIPSRKEGRSPL